MSDMEDFKRELSELLDRHRVAIIVKSNKNDDDNSVEVGFMRGLHIQEWTGRHHVTGFDLDV